MRKMICVLLSLMLALCALPALAETCTLGGLSFTLPEGYVVAEKTDGGVLYNREDAETGYSFLGVSINDPLAFCDVLGLTQEWVEDQLDNGGEFTREIVNGQNTVVAQYKQDDDPVSIALLACYIDGKTVIAFELTQSTPYLVGQDALNALMEMAGDDRSLMLGGTAQVRGDRTLDDVYDPADHPDVAAADQLLTRGSDGVFRFCGLEWDAPVSTALKTIARTMDCTLELTGSGTAYMGSSQTGPELLGRWPALTIVKLGEAGWSVEFQLHPRDRSLASPEEAADWFNALWADAENEFGTADGCSLYVGSDAYTVVPSMLTASWLSFAQGEQYAYAEANFGNMTLSLEKEVYPINGVDTAAYSIWVYIDQP